MSKLRELLDTRFPGVEWIEVSDKDMMEIGHAEKLAYSMTIKNRSGEVDYKIIEFRKDEGSPVRCLNIKVGFDDIMYLVTVTSREKIKKLLREKFPGKEWVETDPDGVVKMIKSENAIFVTLKNWEVDDMEITTYGKKGVVYRGDDAMCVRVKPDGEDARYYMEKEENEKLSGCPFCGVKPEMRVRNDGITLIKCVRCGVMMSGNKKKETIDTWNTRANIESVVIDEYKRQDNHFIYELSAMLHRGITREQTFLGVSFELVTPSKVSELTVDASMAIYNNHTAVTYRKLSGKELVVVGIKPLGSSNFVYFKATKL